MDFKLLKISLFLWGLKYKDIFYLNNYTIFNTTIFIVSFILIFLRLFIDSNNIVFSIISITISLYNILLLIISISFNIISSHRIKKIDTNSLQELNNIIDSFISNMEDDDNDK